MSMTIHVDIVSAEAKIFSGTAEMVVACAQLGEVGITPRHAQMLTSLRPGEVRVIKHGGEEETFFINGGLLEIQPYAVTILADVAKRVEELDEAAALVVKQQAEQALAERKSVDFDYAEARAALAEAMAQLQAIQKIRKRLKGS